MFHEGGWAIWLVVFWLLLDVVAIAVTARLLIRAWQQRLHLKLVVKILSAIVLAASILGGGGTLWGLVTALLVVPGDTVDPSQKARALAEGISEAMNCTAFGLLVWLPIALVFAFVLRRALRAAR